MNYVVACGDGGSKDTSETCIDGSWVSTDLAALLEFIGFMFMK